MKQKLFTNCFLVKIDNKGVLTHVCLAMKKRGFGQGMWNGSGGKPEKNETVENAAKSEVREEFKVTVNKIEKRGEIGFALEKEKKTVLMHTFLVTDWQGEPVETEEMKPQWFPINAVPYSEMWASDKEWLPSILMGKKLKAKYTYDHEGGSVKKKELTEIENFD
jgi:ADP-ribose pyrophosphatase YjhB (NUDIX family)